MSQTPFYSTGPPAALAMSGVQQGDEQRPNGSKNVPPFGYILDSASDVNNQPPASKSGQRATLALGSYSIPEQINGILRSHRDQRGGSTHRSPLYFDHINGRSLGGLVCGLENEVKCSIFKSLVASCLRGSEQDSNGGHPRGETARGVLCFTAEYGSLDIVNALSSLRQDGQVASDVQVVVLTSNVNALRDLHAKHSHSDLKPTFLPLKIHYEDLELGHMTHVSNDAFRLSELWCTPENNYERTGDVRPLRTLLYDGLGGGPYADIIQRHFSRKFAYPDPDQGYKCLRPPKWLDWVVSGQPDLPPGGIEKEGITPENPPLVASNVHTLDKPLVLCVDYSYFLPGQERILSVLSDVILKAWVERYPLASHLGGYTAVFCDNTELYLSAGPFERSLTHLISGAWSRENALPNTPESEQLGSNIVVFSKAPSSLPPTLLDHLSYLILHRFTSPRWLESLKDYFALPSGADLMARVLDLGRDEALFYTPSPQNVYSVPFSRAVRVVESAGSIDGFVQPPTTAGYKVQRRRGLKQQLALVRLWTGGQDVDLGEDVELELLENASAQPNSRVGQTQLAGAYGPVLPVHAGGQSDGEYASSRQYPNAPTLDVAYAPSNQPWRSGSSLTSGESNTGTSGSAALGGESVSLNIGRSTGVPSVGVIGSNVNGTASNVHNHNGPDGPVNSATSCFFPQASHRAALSPEGSSFSPPNGHSYHRSPPSGLSLSSSSMTPSIGAGNPIFSPFDPPLRPQQLGNHGFGSSARTAKDMRGGKGGEYQLPSLSENSPRFQVPSEGQSSNEMESSIADSSTDYVKVGAASGAETKPSIGSTPLSKNSSDAPPSASISHGQSLFTRSYGWPVLGHKSYAGATAPQSGIEAGLQRRETAAPHPMKNAGSMPGSAGSNSTLPRTSSHDHPYPYQYQTQRGCGSQDMPMPMPMPMPTPAPATASASAPNNETPPTYPESFFWPLLDALEKARAQVSTPHNRAQSVRHSVVGQELPPSARARLGLTFKEYVAAASRAGVIVTGDSGDKAWIALKEWKYPGKNLATNSHVAHAAHAAHAGSGGNGGSNGRGAGSAHMVGVVRIMSK